MKIRTFFKKLGKWGATKDEPAPLAPSASAPQAEFPPKATPKVQVKENPQRPENPQRQENPAAVVIPVRPPQKAHVPAAPSSPLALKGGAKTQSDWLLLQIGKTGRAFIALAEKNQLPIQAPAASDESFVRHDMTAALLGYRLVLTAYHVHQEIPSLEALRNVRTAMIGMLHRAVDITIEQMGAKDLRRSLLGIAEEQFKKAEAEVAAACMKVKAQAPEPFSGF
ncbi:MAG: hypothetical protein HC883_01180, partial [Bdellovibrionaceae bacterium]|nr:hypothetical protein [Pseudobdellovibrionaceae bacterium]